jgi:ParB family transcriptional regulator, chromosome partitioning protein
LIYREIILRLLDIPRQQLGDAALASFEDRPVHDDPTKIARAGVFVSIDSHDNLSVDRGMRKAADAAPSASPPE